MKESDSKAALFVLSVLSAVASRGGGRALYPDREVPRSCSCLSIYDLEHESNQNSPKMCCSSIILLYTCIISGLPASPIKALQLIQNAAFLMSHA